MGQEWISTTLLALIAVSAALRVSLNGRQIGYLQRQRRTLPRGASRPHAEERALDTTIARARTAIGGIVAETAALTWLIAAGVADLEAIARTAAMGPVATAALLVSAVVVVRGAVRLGETSVNVFAIDRRAGLGAPPVGVFVADAAKRALVAGSYAAILASAVAALMESAVILWWLWAWAFWYAAFFARMWLGPFLDVRVFYPATPLADPLLAERLRHLLERCELALTEIRVIGASARTRRANASIQGFGKRKRIVLHDTLLKELDHSEVEAVVAHEAGHARRRHIPRYLIGAGVCGLAAAAGLAAAGPWLGATTAVRLANFTIALPALGLFLRPIASAFLRRWEFEADEFAASHVGAHRMADALRKLYAANANAQRSEPIYTLFFASHPEPAQRLERLSLPQPNSSASDSANSRSALVPLSR
jgi:STE24 endopeptidase